MLRRKLLILGIIALASGCGKLSVVEPGRIKRAPAPLRFGLMSYMSPADVHRLFEDFPKTIVEDSASPPRETCPRFDVLTLSFVDVQDLAYPGELNVGFINGRLHSVWFYPEASGSYVTALTDSGVAFDSEDEFHPSTHVRGWTYTAHDGRRYVGWEDERLRDEINDWIMACS